MHSINKLDRLISKNNNKYKLNSLDLINHTDHKNGTPVTIASIYDPMDQKQIVMEELVVLIDSGALHSMAKASLVMKYKIPTLNGARLSTKLQLE